MRERVEALPRSARPAAVLMLAVPLVLWLFLVWDTRPYSPEEIDADRAAAERDPAFAQTVEACESLNIPVVSWLGDGFATRYSSPGHCRGQALETHSSLTREPLRMDDEWWDAGTLALLSMAAAMLLVGVRLQPTPGARSFLRRAGKVLVLGTVAALVLDSTWWWALGWIAERRGILDTGIPTQFISSGAVLTGLSGVVGLAGGLLLRGPVRAVATLATAAVAIGVLVLFVHPLDPWLPMINVEAFLYGEAEYVRPSQEVSCDHQAWPSIYGSPDPVSPSDVCTSHYATRTAAGAAGYLFGGVSILALAAASTNIRRRGPRQPA